jgi:type II secretion system protein N
MRTDRRIVSWLVFIVYGFVLFAVLTYSRLPADKILSKVIETVTQGKVQVTAEKMSSSLLSGYRLENLTWIIQSERGVVSAKMECLTLSPRFLGLLSGYLPMEMKGVVAKGTFQLDAGVSMIHGLKEGYAKLKALGIHLGDLAIMNPILQREISGKLTGEAEFYGPLNEPRKLVGHATILVEDGAVDTRMDAFGLKTIPFQRFSLPVTVRNGVASLKKGQLTGPLLAGEFEGQIELLQNIQVSPLQVTATMRPGPSLTSRKGSGFTMEDKPFVIRLGGTIGKPFFNLAGG